MAENGNLEISDIEHHCLKNLAIARISVKGLGKTEIGTVAVYKNGVIIFEDPVTGQMKITTLMKMWVDWGMDERKAAQEAT